MTAVGAICAVVPVKRFDAAKQRLAARFSPAFRRALAPLMLEDVLAALRAARRLGGIVVVTEDAQAAGLARAVGARVFVEGARDGHTGAVMAAARLLAAEGWAGMLTVPGDIPGVTAAEIDALIDGHVRFSIVPAHDGRGSNAVVCSPPDLMPLAFGDDSCRPHIAAAAARGLDPLVVHFEGIGLDVDAPEDLIALAARRWPTRTQALLERSGIGAASLAMAGER